MPARPAFNGESILFFRYIYTSHPAHSGSGRVRQAYKLIIIPDTVTFFGNTIYATKTVTSIWNPQKNSMPQVCVQTKGS